VHLGPSSITPNKIRELKLPVRFISSVGDYRYKDMHEHVHLLCKVPRFPVFQHH